MPTCSVVIPVYNLANVTEQCLTHLIATVPEAPEVEIIVVDDGSRDATPRLLADYGDRIRVVRHATNQGFARSCNDGAAVATGRYLIFLNNDMVPRAGWLDALVRHAERDPAIGAVGAKLLFTDGRIQHAGMVFDRGGEPRNIYVGFPADHPAVNRSRRYQAVTGACLLVRRKVFASAGGFDEAFRNGYEDVDFCLRLGVLGYHVSYCHESVLVHFESVSEGRCDDDDRNRRLFAQRWGHRVRSDDIEYYVEDDLLRLTYLTTYPMQVRVSPLLAVVDDEGRPRDVERLLAVRTRQVHQLLKENIGLLVRQAEHISDLRSA